jgi:hypothetical protein
MTSKPNSEPWLGEVWEKPVYYPGGVRHVVGASLIRASEQKTWEPVVLDYSNQPREDKASAEAGRQRIATGEVQSTTIERARVLRRGTGTD